MRCPGSAPGVGAAASWNISPQICSPQNHILCLANPFSQKHHQQLMLAQIAVNKEEAKGNWFQSSWRPATAWVCVGGFAVNFLISPMAAPFGIVVPQADTGTMLPVLMGMLELGGMRTMERVKGVGK